MPKQVFIVLRHDLYFDGLVEHRDSFDFIDEVFDDGVDFMFFNEFFEDSCFFKMAFLFEILDLGDS